MSGSSEGKKPPENSTPSQAAPDTPGNEKTMVISDSKTLREALAEAEKIPACLIIVRGTPQGHRLFLNQNEMILGRDPAVEISIADPGISRKHAKITKTGTDVFLTDLGSANGTFINDKRVPSNSTIPLTKEDMIKVGTSILKFLPAGHLESALIGNLADEAYRDKLTQAYNRRYFDERYEAEFKRAKALHHDFSILLFDLDKFHDLNRNFTMQGGDYVLKEFARLVSTQYLKPKEVFCRYGGEEFVIILYGQNAQSAMDLAERIRAGIEAHAFIFQGKRIPVTASIGVSEISSAIESSKKLFEVADAAMVQAKDSGRNRVVLGS